MDAKELRIGNLVNQGPRYGDCCIEAYELYQYSMFIKNPIGVADYYKDWKPIPLTEEWLVKFGFDIKNGVSKLDFSKHHLECFDQLVFNLKDNYNYCLKQWRGEMLDAWYISEKEVKYIHQLQNLYFALSGEELTIKDK